MSLLLAINFYLTFGAILAIHWMIITPEIHEKFVEDIRDECGYMLDPVLYNKPLMFILLMLFAPIGVVKGLIKIITGK